MAMSFIHGFHLNNLRGDVYGGIVAAVLALPLALAFGERWTPFIGQEN